MTKGFTRLFTVLLLACCAVGAYALEKDADGAYIISNGADLKEFGNIVSGGEASANAKLSADIDISDYKWTPIGDPYSGVFDGKKHTVKGLTITKNSNNFLGLFGTNSGTIKNVTVEEANITVSTAFVTVRQGAIAGENKGSIINCHSVNSTMDNFSTGIASKVGGLVGVNSGTIDGCSNIGGQCIVRSLSEVVGGIAGSNSGTIKNCENTAKVENSYSALSATNHTGGICGAADNGTVENCFNGGEVTGKSGNVGAIAGTTNSKTEVEDCAWDKTKTNAPGLGNGAGQESNVNGYTTEEIESGAIEKDSTGTIVVNHFVNKYDYCCAYGTPEKVYGTEDIFNYENHSEIVTTGGIPATCLKEGHTEGKLCKGCGLHIVESKVIAKTSHILDTLKGVAPTCLQTGKADSIYCELCHTVFQTPEILLALGHDTVKIKPVKPTCTVNGSADSTYCGRCHEGLHSCTVIPAHGHDTITIEAIEPTCHSFGWSEEIVCKQCKEVLTAKTKIDKTDHKEVVDPGFPASCKKLGKTDGSHCEVCGEIIKMQTIIGLQPHDTVETVPAIEPGCETPGYTAELKCGVCDKLLQDIEMTPSLGGHQCELVGFVEANDSLGYTGDSICTICHDTLVYGKIYGTDDVHQHSANNIQVISADGKIIVDNAPYETIEVFSITGDKIISSKSVSVRHEIAVRRQQVYLVKVANNVYKIAVK